MAEYEEKFFVFNRKHLSGLSEEAREKVEEAMECVSDELVEHNYYVCNQDEPYADDVIETILKGEDLKAVRAVRKVFLGGTCNESVWRDVLIDMLNIDFFNPVVDDWTPECMEEERKQREECDFCLYVITPEMTGVYSIGEVVDDSNKRPAKTVFCYTNDCSKISFTAHQIKSLGQIGEMVTRNGGKVCGTLKDVAGFLNSYQ